MPASLSEVRAGLAAKLSVVSGLRAYAYMHPKPEAAPAAICVSGPKAGTTYGDTFDGKWTILFDAWVFVNPADLVRAQQTLDAYLDSSGTKSLAAALEADPSLGSLPVSCRVVSVSEPPRLVDTAGGQLLGAAVGLEVYA